MGNPREWWGQVARLSCPLCMCVYIYNLLCRCSVVNLYRNCHGGGVGWVIFDVEVSARNHTRDAHSPYHRSPCTGHSHVDTHASAHIYTQVCMHVCMFPWMSSAVASDIVALTLLRPPACPFSCVRAHRRCPWRNWTCTATEAWDGTTARLVCLA